MRKNLNFKGDVLYVGSAGKENVYDGVITDYNMNWVRVGATFHVYLFYISSHITLEFVDFTTKST